MSKTSLELKEEVLLVQELLENLTDILDSSPSPIPTARLSRLHAAIIQVGGVIEAMAERTSVRKGDIVKRFKWPFSEKENGDYLLKLGRFKSTVLLALSIEEKFAHCEF